MSQHRGAGAGIMEKYRQQLASLVVYSYMTIFWSMSHKNKYTIKLLNNYDMNWSGDRWVWAESVLHMCPDHNWQTCLHAAEYEQGVARKQWRQNLFQYASVVFTSCSSMVLQVYRYKWINPRINLRLGIVYSLYTFIPYRPFLGQFGQAASGATRLEFENMLGILSASSQLPSHNSTQYQYCTNHPSSVPSPAVPGVHAAGALIAVMVYCVAMCTKKMPPPVPCSNHFSQTVDFFVESKPAGRDVEICNM